MDRRKKTIFEESLENNMSAYYRYFNQLSELCIGVWKWHNLPDSMDERYLEYTLMRNGSAVIFVDEIIGMLGMRVTFGGNFDVYGYPLLRHAYSHYNGYHRLLTQKNSVICYNNNIRTNSVYAINQYAKRLYTYDRIMDINVNGQKTPLALVVPENKRLTAENLYKEYDGNQPIIFGEDKLVIDGLKAIKTDTPFLADRIYSLKQQVWNEALTFLGIRNVNQGKRERLIEAEVDISNIDANYMKNTKLACRNLAADKVNRMFGTDIWVEFIGEEIMSSLGFEKGGENSE